MISWFVIGLAFAMGLGIGVVVGFLASTMSENGLRHKRPPL